jgi:hypothetical protein
VRVTPKIFKRLVFLGENRWKVDRASSAAGSEFTTLPLPIGLIKMVFYPNANNKTP